MNILHISRTMGQGGAEKVVYQLCKEKDKNIHMVVASTGGYFATELAKKNIKNYEIPDIEGKNPIQMLKTFIILFKLVKNEKIDIIHSHHRMAAFYSRILNVFYPHLKRVYTAHNVFTNKRKLTAFSLKKSAIVACGNGVKKNLTDYFKITDNIHVIYNSIENNVSKQVSRDQEFKEYKDKILIGTIGRLSEQKGIDIFIKALANVIKDDKNVFGIIIGDGELKDEMIGLTKELGITKNIIFLGFRTDVLELINCLDFVVLSSRWEGFPLTPMETFSQKKTIIATNIDGNNEIVINNENGLLFEKDNVKELTEKIKYLIDNTNIKKELEKNAYKAYINKYSYDIFIKNYYNLYKRLI